MARPLAGAWRSKGVGQNAMAKPLHSRGPAGPTEPAYGRQQPAGLHAQDYSEAGPLGQPPPIPEATRSEIQTCLLSILPQGFQQKVLCF